MTVQAVRPMMRADMHGGNTIPSRLSVIFYIFRIMPESVAFIFFKPRTFRNR